MTKTSPGTVRPIVYYGQDVLHKPCREVTEFDDSLATLIDDMFASMYEVDGVGLAANQIGVDLRVFVMDVADGDANRVVAHVVNPTLHPAEPPRELAVREEGCLSVPGQYTDVARPAYAKVSGFDKTGAPITIAGTGQLGRCLQHESDHLDGMVYVDRLPKKVRKRLLSDAGLV